MATIAQLETALRNADKAGDMDAARKLAAVIISARTESANQIPDAQIPATLQTDQQPRIGEKLVGAYETIGAMGTGATTGALGMVGGAVKGIAESILSGEFGTPEAQKLVEQAALRGAQAGTYSPRTPEGQRMTQSIGQSLANVIPPVLPVIAAPGALMQATRNAAPIAQATAQRVAGAAQQAARTTGQAIAKPVQAATTAVRETFGMEVEPTPSSSGSRVSGGGAATPRA